LQTLLILTNFIYFLQKNINFEFFFTAIAQKNFLETFFIHLDEKDPFTKVRLTYKSIFVFGFVREEPV